MCVCVRVCVCVCESLLKLEVLVNYFHLGIRNTFSQLCCVSSSLWLTVCHMVAHSEPCAEKNTHSII